MENDSINPLNLVNIYNGGGVGIGDFNKDGLPDIFFTGNRVPCRLYLNRGQFQFEDVTETAGVAGMGRWARGVSVVDINNDGLLDIYICNTIYKDSLRRRNILYVNQGVDKDGIPHFIDSAADYGLDIHLQSTMASFFDYDNDGDLDMYLTVNEAVNGYSYSVFSPKNGQGGGSGRGRLYRNDWDTVLGHPVFHDVSDAAGIIYQGLGHAATICDINGDGWKDIYVSDDFISNNILYINNHDGTFTDRLKDYFKHTSLNSMGQDVVDINNDGLPDVIELDMSPHDNYRKKTMSASDNYFAYQQFDQFGYEYQYVRNTLQLNRGPRVGQNDSIGIPAFSEIGFLSGISQTDWSWTPLVGDFDNDGYRDLIITNGFPRDVSDLDFVAYQKTSRGKVSQKELLDRIPQVKLHNFAYRNKGDLSFSDETARWGLGERTFSNGAAYADFDNDGAIDMVINNIDDEACLYRNTARDKDKVTTHYLQIQYKGPSKNVNGLGAVASIYYDHGKQQVYDNNPYRGYLSSMEGITHFGLARTSVVDSVVIKWSNGRKQILSNVKADQLLTVDIADAKEPYSLAQPAVAGDALFSEITNQKGITYRDSGRDFIDFNIQQLLPHKFTGYSPALAAGDIDGNGYDDLVIGGEEGIPAHLLLQEADGKFLKKELPAEDNGLPTERKGMPVERKGLPTEQKGLSVERKGMPAERKGLPSERKGLPTEQKGMPVERKGLSVERKGLPSEQKGLPIEQKGLPVERKGLSVERKGLPSGQKGLPTERKGMPVERKGLPSERKGLPTEQKGMPAERKGLSVERKGLSSERKGMLSEQKGLSSERKGMHTERNSLPVTSHGLWPGAKSEGLLLFDANGDGKPDLYIASGGYTLPAGSKDYQDRLYINDGKGNFRLDSAALPPVFNPKFCVRAADYNGDGKLDLFVSGRVDPWNYPRPVSSYIFRNDSEKGHVKFTDVTQEVAPGLRNIGMVCDALFTDFDGDGQMDLIVAGEWMPITFLRNGNGKFKDVTIGTGVGGQAGWWNSIVAGDFRHTGRTDYIVGNTGSNSLYQASEQEPVGMTAKDFNGNGKYIGIPSLFLPDQDGEKKEFPAPGRDDIARVLPVIKKKYPTYKPFALATMEEVLTPEQSQGALHLKANMLKSCFLRNDGGGKFTLIPLPAEARFSVINGMVADDFDGDGNLDVLINGNDFGTAVGIGRYDAMNGLLLKGDGTGQFTPLSILQSGIYIPGDGKALVKLRGASGAGRGHGPARTSGPARGSGTGATSESGASRDYLVAASQNKDVLKLYRRKAKIRGIDIRPDDVSALIRYKNGKIRKEEFYYGSSFLSQSARFLDLSGEVVSVIITDYKGKSRTIGARP